MLGAIKLVTKRTSFRINALRIGNGRRLHGLTKVLFGRRAILGLEAMRSDQCRRCHIGGTWERVPVEGQRPEEHIP